MYPVLAGLGLLGIIITAALFLAMLQQMFLGELPERWKDWPRLEWPERWALGLLLLFVVAIGVSPATLLGVIQPAAESLVALIGMG